MSIFQLKNLNIINFDANFVKRIPSNFEISLEYRRGSHYRKFTAVLKKEGGETALAVLLEEET